MAQTLYNPNTIPATQNGNLIVATFNQIDAGSVGNHTSWTAPFACIAISGEAKYHTNAGGAASLHVSKDGSGVSPGTGVEWLVAGLVFANLNNTIDTAHGGVFSNVAADLTMAAGDSIGLRQTGGATGVSDLNVTIVLARI